MKRLIAFIALIALSGWAHAADAVVVKDAWVRAPAPGAEIAAAYMTLEANKPVALTGAVSPAAKAVEVHSMSMKNGVMEMCEIKTLDLKPGQPTTLEPGGLHLMLIDLTKPLKVGDRVKIVLHFGKGRKSAFTQTLTVPVKSAP